MRTSSAMVVMLGLCTAPITVVAQQSVDTAAYTTLPFENAPEAIVRVEGWKRQGNAILLTTLANPCGTRPGSTYHVLVHGADRSTFHRGDFVITGIVHESNSAYWAIRMLTRSEVESLGACPRRPLP